VSGLWEKRELVNIVKIFIRLKYLVLLQNFNLVIVFLLVSIRFSFL